MLLRPLTHAEPRLLTALLRSYSAWFPRLPRTQRLLRGTPLHALSLLSASLRKLCFSRCCSTMSRWTPILFSGRRSLTQACFLDSAHSWKISREGDRLKLFMMKSTTVRNNPFSNDPSHTYPCQLLVGKELKQPRVSTAARGPWTRRTYDTRVKEQYHKKETHLPWIGSEAEELFHRPSWQWWSIHVSASGPGLK